MDREKSIAIKLADNEKKVRTRALTQIRNYISAKANSKDEPFGEEDLVKLWKGLHYCMWMADKPLIQVSSSSLNSNYLSIR
jgi:ribosomal RNA-processing protein 1